ncbi:MAG: hypothetical protein QHH01_02215, partial [Spirochaetales bacterium]|nr:hypothetical protein [Spirochaetales bacterium]
MKIDRKKGAWIVFVLYILVGLPVGIEPTLIRGSTAYLDSVDFWVGNIYLIVLGLIEVVVMGWLYRDKGLQLINRGSYWKLSKGFYRIFIQVLTPLIIIVFLIGFITQQKFDALFSSPWATAGQIVVLAVLIIGLVMSYKSIKDKYGREISENRIIVVKE